MNNVLILGAKGMLGSQLVSRFTKSIAWDKEEADVREFDSLKQKILDLPKAPEAIINCIAFNDVDGAETRQPDAFALNAEFVGKLAVLAKQLDVPLVHFSSNYVFGSGKGEYDESEEPAPACVYGQSKYQGEKLLRQNTDKYYLIRTAVLFGPAGSSAASKRSFVELMMGLAEKNETIKVVEDEVNSLTLVTDLADAVKFLLNEKKPYGIYHIANSGQASWYDFAKEIFSFLKKDVTLLPVSSSDFKRPAARPKRAVLKNTKLYRLQPWPEALREYLVKEYLAKK